MRESFLPATIAVLLLASSTALAQGDKLTLCHVPPGNPDNAHEIVVARRAVPAHLEHGDSIGPCPFCGNGVVNPPEECDPPGSLCSHCVCGDCPPDAEACLCFCTLGHCTADCLCEDLPPSDCGVDSSGQCGGECPPGLECQRTGSALDDCDCVATPVCEERTVCGGPCGTPDNPGDCRAVPGGACRCVNIGNICLPPPPRPCGDVEGPQCGEGLCDDPNEECRPLNPTSPTCRCVSAAPAP